MITRALRILLEENLVALKVDFKDEEGYSIANLKGPSSKSDMLAAFEKIFLYSSLKKASKMLVDCRGIETVMQLGDIAKISEKFNNIKKDYEGLMNNQVTFAFLINKDLHDPNTINKTLYEDQDQHAYVGVDYDEAVKWLISKKVEILQMA